MSDMVTVDGTVVRPAEPAETEEVELLARWSDRAHLRFQLDCLPELVRSGQVILAVQGGRLCGLTYTVLDYPNCSIRGLAVRPGRSVEVVTEAVLTHVVPNAKELGALSIVYIGDDAWLVPYLAKAGFARDGQIIVLHRPGAFISSLGCQDCLIRQATADDIDDLVAVDWSAFAPLWRNGPETIRQFLQQMPHFLVASSGDKVLGFICGTEYGKVGHIVRLAVHPEAQRRGVGTRLLRDTLAHMSEHGVRTLTLNTQKDNLASQAFYRCLGFYVSRAPTSVYRYMLR
ncbi:MAG: GNAT family N-acetyltransferase [Anaerolineae bacterium]